MGNVPSKRRCKVALDNLPLLVFVKICSCLAHNELTQCRLISKTMRCRIDAYFCLPKLVKLSDSVVKVCRAGGLPVNSKRAVINALLFPIFKPDLCLFPALQNAEFSSVISRHNFQAFLRFYPNLIELRIHSDVLASEEHMFPAAQPLGVRKLYLMLELPISLSKPKKPSSLKFLTTNFNELMESTVCPCLTTFHVEIVSTEIGQFYPSYGILFKFITRQSQLSKVILVGPRLKPPSTVTIVEILKILAEVAGTIKFELKIEFMNSDLRAGFK